jgi:hypothetical protein
MKIPEITVHNNNYMKIQQYSLRCGVLTEVNVKTAVFWDVTLSIPEKVYRYFDTSMAPASSSIKMVVIPRQYQYNSIRLHGITSRNAAILNKYTRTHPTFLVLY